MMIDDIINAVMHEKEYIKNGIKLQEVRDLDGIIANDKHYVSTFVYSLILIN